MKCNFCKVEYPSTEFYSGSRKCKCCYNAIRVVKHPTDHTQARVERSHAYLSLAGGDSYKVKLGLSKNSIFEYSDEDIKNIGMASMRVMMLPLYQDKKHTEDLKLLTERMLKIFS